MPILRYGGTTSRTTRRKTATAKASAMAQGARAAAAKARRAALREEIKAVVASGKESKDEQSAVSLDNAVSSSGAFHGAPYALGQGAGVWARIGDCIQPTKFVLNYQWGLSNSSDAHNNVRLMIVQCKVPDSEASTADFPDVYSHPSDEFRRKYTVLFDEKLILNAKPLGTGGYMGYKLPFKVVDLWGKKLRKMRWSDTASAVAPNVYGSIKIYTVSDSALASHPLLSFHFRQYAKDDM